ncbi:hypothetical protein AVEN_19441-1 [Araneus ventricosus]|uniref:Uncharacterized protein n=1 Tax=Araneus ventricosus TaxID=182803 RepID=A0A4Y2C869_ARAVE|nr:hypothetical protein AVEN_19441-1 [Araneus ventricosus]
MQKFQNLKEVRLSYQCASDDILAILCMSHGAALQHLTVTCDSSEGLRHRIHPDSWSKLRRKYPDIKINFYVVEVVTQDQFLSLLPQTTEICGFSYRCGLSLQSEQNLRTHALPILQYLQQAFACFLRSITLEFGFVTVPDLDGAIVDLLKSCKWIESVYLSGVMRTQLAVKVCERALQEGSGSLGTASVPSTALIQDILLLKFLSGHRGYNRLGSKHLRSRLIL